MKIAVCLKEVVDATLSLGFGLSNEVLFKEGLPLRLNPDDAGALSKALSLKESDSGSQVEIILLSIGPERVESYLRDGLAMGADRAVRIWDEGFNGLSSRQKSLLLSKAVSVSGADLILTGARSMDTGNSQTGQLIAAQLDLPCVSEVISFEADKEGKEVTLIKDIGKGAREKLQCSLPAVVTVKGEAELPYASLDRLLESQKNEVMRLSLSDLGISASEMRNDPTEVTGLVYPRPRPKKVPTPDSSLPAFYRILKLLEGGISKRQGRMLEGSTDEMVDQLFQLFIEEGVIEPAAK